MQSVTTLDVEDLEVDATPEDLMMSYVSGEKGKVRLTSSLSVLCPCLFRFWRVLGRLACKSGREGQGSGFVPEVCFYCSVI